MTKEYRENGAITVEATIALPIFMFAIITILSIVNICTAQARIATAVNTTAKELSQYSYMYALTGFQETHQQWADEGDKASEQIENVVDTANNVFNEIEGLAESGLNSPSNIEELLNQYNAIMGSAENIAQSAEQLEALISEIANNPRDLIFGLVKLVGSEALDTVFSKLIAAPVAKQMSKRHLVNEKNGDVETYLKGLNIVPAANGSYLDGLDFSESSMFAGGDDRIIITCKYKVMPIQLLPLNLEFTFRCMAVTKLWPADQSLGEIFGDQ